MFRYQFLHLGLIILLQITNSWFNQHNSKILNCTVMIKLMYGITFLSPLFLLCGVIMGGVFFKKISSTGKLILCYLIAVLFIDLLSRYLGFISGNKNNLILLSINGIIDLTFFSLLYSLYYIGSKHAILRIITFVALLVVIYLLFEKTFKVISGFDSYDKVICDGIIVVYAMMSMLDLLKSKSILSKEILRVNTIVLLFFSFDLLFSLVINFLMNAGLNYVIYFYLLRTALLLTLYILLIHTLWQTGKNRKHLQYG